VSVTKVKVAILSGGRDKPYALGLAQALAQKGVALDFIGSDQFRVSALLDNPRVRFLNLRGDQEPTSVLRKALRVSRYYYRLIRYATASEPTLFHILWNNHFEHFDRTILVLYYRVRGKRLVFTAHNVNAGRRDGNDSWLNRLSLRFQYRWVDHVFVHTCRMKQELMDEFDVAAGKITVIPFGLNSTIPRTALTPQRAKERLGLTNQNRVVLFFGNIAPYKGLHHLVRAFATVLASSADYRLVIAGSPKKGSEEYWADIRRTIQHMNIDSRVLVRDEFIPDDEIELYFKAGDLLVLPYTHIFQSGVLFLGYNFGLPALVADVGALKENLVQGTEAMVFRSGDEVDLGAAIERYFASDLYATLESHREHIREAASMRYSWNRAAELMTGAYASVLGAESR
jgi:D-inositol-3-phosphate glycosyltransferase